MFLVAANTRRALVGQKEWITTGSSGIQVQFLFSDDWEGLSKFAVFRNAEIEESKIPIALPESNLTELPAENCAAEYVDEKVYVGVYGSDGLGHIIIPTIWVSLGILKEGAAYEGMDPPQPTPDMWAQILAIAQNAGAENAEAAEKAAGEAKDAVTHYPKIVDGYWYVWNSETETWVNTGIRAEGQNGYSPEVTITEIEGGHRVTITDEDHPQGQTFDVMDGQGGSTGDYDELTNRPRINGHTLTGNQSAADLGLGTYSKPASGIPKTDLASDVQASLGKADTALQTAPVQSVAGKTGAVNLGAGDVGFNSSEEYNEGTVGAKVADLNRQLSDKPDINLGITRASVGQIIKVLTVDANGKPQTWEAVDEDRVVTVNGTTATIVAEAGVRYVCGELAELTFTPPASGLTAVRFTSGTTPTVISLLPAADVKMPDDWTGTLEANQVYEINFEDRLGLVSQWS